MAIFALDEGRFELIDSLGGRRTGTRKLRPVATVKGGAIYGAATYPVERI